MQNDGVILVLSTYFISVITYWRITLVLSIHINHSSLLSFEINEASVPANQAHLSLNSSMLHCNADKIKNITKYHVLKIIQIYIRSLSIATIHDREHSKKYHAHNISKKRIIN